eukprot:2634352-Rhodomonas_salina.1
MRKLGSPGMEEIERNKVRGLAGNARQDLVPRGQRDGGGTRGSGAGRAMPSRNGGLRIRMCHLVQGRRVCGRRMSLEAMI